MSSATAAAAATAKAASDGPPLHRLIACEIAAAGGWIGFERYMALALYAPGLGYYARADRQFGASPRDGSDFVTAPELSPLFGRALARQVAQALRATGTREVWEFGAGSGALAVQLLSALAADIDRYVIVELSAALRARQRTALAAAHPALIDKLHWADALPASIAAVVVGNEVLDAMPVALLHFDGAGWHERGVALAVGRTAGAADAPNAADASRASHRSPFVFADRPTALRPPIEAGTVPGTTTELHRHAEAFVRTLAGTLQRGAAFFVDYGFPEAEHHHPQRTGGTLMCHRAHRADADPLADVGEKDITAHVDFTAVALAGQDAGLAVLGYTTQARFLMNCGLLDDLRGADVRSVAAAKMLLNEHEMGELFKVIGFAKLDAAGAAFDALGFAHGDRTHTL